MQKGLGFRVCGFRVYRGRRVSGLGHAMSLVPIGTRKGASPKNNFLGP